MSSRLTDQERELLQDIVELHEQHGQLTIHSNMKPEDRELIASLMLKGMVELRALVKEHPHEERPVVPTRVGVQTIQAERFDGAADLMAEEGVSC